MVSSFRALTIQSGITTQIQDGYTLLVGVGIDTDSAEALVIGGAVANAVTLHPATTASSTLTSTGMLTASNALTVTTGTTTLGAALTQSGGAVSLTATGASSFTSDAALTLTGGADSTWSTSAGALTVDAAAALNLGTVHATSVSIANTGITTTANGPLTSTGLLTASAALTVSTGSLTVSTLSTGIAHVISGVFTSSLIVDADVSATAAIAGTKISPNFGSQAVTTSDNISTTGSGTITSAGLLTASAALTVSSGAVTITPFHAAGIVTNDASGVLHTSVGTVGQALFTSAGTATPAWTTFSGDVSASVSTVGQITVNQINGATVPAAGLLTTGNVLQVSGSSALTYGAVNLAGGSNYVTGNLPVTNVAPGSTAQVLMTNGSIPTWTTLSGDASVSATGAVTVVSAAGNFEIHGNLTVDGTENVVGQSVFQSNAVFDGYVATNTLESLSGALTIDGYAGVNLQAAGSTYLDVGVTTNNIIYVPAGVTLEAQAGGSIIATSSSGTEEITITGVDTSAVGAINDAVYVSGSNAVHSAEANSLSTSYCAGFAKDKTAGGNLYTDGLVIPNITGSASPGNVMYLDPASVGKVTATAPSTVGQVVAPVGFMLTPTQMVIRILTPVQL